MIVFNYRTTSCQKFNEMPVKLSRLWAEELDERWFEDSPKIENLTIEGIFKRMEKMIIW